MPSTREVATQFVDLALKYERWGDVETLPADEVQVLFDIVSAAGFDPAAVVPGKLSGSYHDQHGSRTGETFLINNHCSFKVVGRDGDDHYFATGWLDCAFRRVVLSFSRPVEHRDELIGKMIVEIERSVPLEPIRLTPEGDFLREYPPNRLSFGFEYFVDHTRDDSRLNSCVGVHKFCGGWMDRRRATEMHDAIVCRSCYMRVLFPKVVKTYGDLRQALVAVTSA